MTIITTTSDCQLASFALMDLFVCLFYVWELRLSLREKELDYPSLRLLPHANTVTCCCLWDCLFVLSGCLLSLSQKSRPFQIV